jgi:outer membrane protein, heavy metal efflux system
MNFGKSTLFLAACCLVWQTPISWGVGAESGAPGLSLDLAKALELALENNVDLQVKRQALGSVRGRVQQAEVLFQENPRLSVDTDYRHRRFALPTGKSGIDTEVRLVQEVEIAGQRGHRREAAAKHLAEAEWSVSDTERVLRLKVTKAFYDFLAAREQIAVYEQILAGQDALLQAGEERFARGDISVIERDTLRLDRDRVYTEFVRKQDKQVRQEQELRSLLGVGADVPFVAAGNLQSLSVQQAERYTLISLEKLEKCASEVRPDLEAAQLNLQVREAELQLAQSQRIPNISVGLLYKLDNEDQIIGGGITVPLPFYNRNQQQIATALADLQVARTQVAARRLAVRQEVAVAYARVRLAEKRLVSYGPAYLDDVQQSVGFSRKAYKAGEIGIFEFSAAQERFTQTRVRYGDALLAYLQAVAELEARAPGCMAGTDTELHAGGNFPVVGSNSQGPDLSSPSVSSMKSRPDDEVQVDLDQTDRRVR